jgi:streptogramin lyase/4-amino-4-deoxy-L-arabinose transferase-like glycosyltransferase
VRPTTIRPFLFGALGVLLAFIGQRALQVAVQGNGPAGGLWEAALFYGAGAVIFLAALAPRAYFPERPFALPARSLPPLNPMRTAVTGGLLVGAGLCAALAWRSFDDGHPNSGTAWQQHLLSVILAVAAAISFDLYTSRWSPTAGRRQPPGGVQAKAHGALLKVRACWQAWALLLLVAATAAGVRLVWLDSLPFGLWYDEAEYGLQAQRILNHPGFRPVFEGAINGPAHYLYLVAGAFDWFGVSAASLRLVNVGFGVATVVAGYLVGCELFGRRMGLVLAALLAGSSWLITLSRLGMHSTSTTPFFTLITLAFVLRALRTGRIGEFALGGVWLGLGLCFYTSFRLFVPPVAFFLLYAAAVSWRQTHAAPPARFWIGVGAMGLTALLVILPLIWFANRQPDIFWSRVQDTFVFTGKSEAERLPVLLENVRRHLLMFNWRGDPNGRHNLPGAPMLDPITAVLFVLGLLYSLYRARDPRYALLPVWLGFTLLGGILSLDFEAPQSLRSNGALGVAYILAVVPLAVLAQAWRVGGGRYYPNFVWWPVAGLLVMVWVANLQTYFVRQANDFAVWAAHSAAETLTADLLRSLDENTDAYVTSFYHGHPTLRFLLPTSRPYTTLATTDQLPLDFAPDRGALLVMHPESNALYAAAKDLYPNASFEEVMPPMPGPPVLYTVRLSPQDVASLQGLDALYYAGAALPGHAAYAQRVQSLQFDWGAAPPLPLPFSAEYTGVLQVAEYGAHKFELQSPGAAELFLGERQVLAGTGVLSTTLTLAEGRHALRLRAVGAPGPFALRWQPPEREWAVVGPGALYAPPVTANGLLARYFANGEWQEPEVRARIEDQLGYYVHVPPLPRPYTVEYTGKIAVPIGGDYRFGLESIDESILYLDGEELVRATAPNTYVEGGVTLEAGLHELRIRFADRTTHTHLNVYWMPPGMTRSILPPAVLFPPQGSYDHVQLPTLAELGAGPAGTTAPAPVLEGTAAVFASGLLQPRGIAVAADGRVFVAESGGSKVVVYAPAGDIIGRIPAGAATFSEPTDLAIKGESLFVLDGGAGELWRFNLDGSDPLQIAADPLILDRSRGVAVGPDGRVWVASAPAALVAAINPEDGTDVRFAVPLEGTAAQPVDTAVTAGGDVYVAEAARNMLLRLAPGGGVERTWQLPLANSLDGAHLALDASGGLYVTDPEGGRVERRDPGGQVVGSWDLGAMVQQPIKAVGLAVGPDGKIWVTDSAGGLVVVLTPAGEQAAGN